MKNVLRRTMVLLGFLAITSGAAHAQIYNGGLPNHANGNEMSGWLQADDFILTSAATITDIRFWTIGFAGKAGWNGSIAWSIFSNAGGTPGATLFSGTQAGTRVATGFLVGSVIPEYQHDLAVGIALAPGTYWLGLHNGPLTHTSDDSYYWETTNLNGTNPGYEDAAPFGSGGWSNTAMDHAFQLYGTPATVVPEPMALSLVGTGLVGLLAFRRRRSNG